MKLYETLAEEIAGSIQSGAFRLGDRLPSVRQLSGSRGISTATVYAAYYLLESRGLVKARERSGYFVTGGHENLPPKVDAVTAPDIGCNSVEVNDLVFQILESARARDIVPFGSAFPDPLAYPWPGLARGMRASLVKADPWRSVDDLGGGNEVLRRQIALRYMVHGIHIPVDEIVITNGALEALNLCLMAVARPGDAVVVESPTFYGALQSLEQRGLLAVEVATHPGEGLDLQALAEALDRHKPKACWLMTNFQNPLGCLMPDRKKRDLVELLARHGTPLIEDDVYGELYFGGSAPRPAKSFDTQGIVMHCSSFSKSLAPGYRIGWAAPGAYAKTVARLKITSSLSASAPAQAALAEYLRKGSFDRHLARLRHAMAGQLQGMLEAIHDSFPGGTRTTRPTGGYFLWVELPAVIDSLRIQRLACEMGISVAPGPMFSSQGHFANCLRMNYGHPWNQRSERAMAELGRLVRAHCGR